MLPTDIQDGAAEKHGSSEGILEVRRQASLLKTGALQDAIFNSANFSSIATDEKGVIQIFNVGAERMLGYAAVDVVNRITPADISDPQELIARATTLSLELDTSITPGFEALVFKASRGIEDIYELTYIRKDGSRFPAIDQSFVHGASHDKTARAIYDASLGVGKQLDMTIVAEGVEDRDDWDLLARTNCDVAQGYFIGRPMPAGAITEWIESWQHRYAQWENNPA
jgi:PAS domain-containing protein